MVIKVLTFIFMEASEIYMRGKVEELLIQIEVEREMKR
jgi:hypothetical protein